MLLLFKMKGNLNAFKDEGKNKIESVFTAESDAAPATSELQVKFGSRTNFVG